MHDMQERLLYLLDNYINMKLKHNKIVESEETKVNIAATTSSTGGEVSPISPVSPTDSGIAGIIRIFIERNIVGL